MTESVEAAEFLGGDYCVRYRGHDVPEHAIRGGDVLVIKEASQPPAPGTLVATINEDRRAQLAEFEPGVSFAGLVVGVMRRVDA